MNNAIRNRRNAFSIKSVIKFTYLSSEYFFDAVFFGDRNGEVWKDL